MIAKKMLHHKNNFKKGYNKWAITMTLEQCISFTNYMYELPIYLVKNTYMSHF